MVGLLPAAVCTHHHWERRLSVVEPLGGIGQLLAGFLRVAGRRVEVLVPEDLSQTHKVVPVVGKELVCHRVPQKVRMQLHADEGAVLVAQRPDTPIRERPTLPDEHLPTFDRRAGLKVRLKGTPSRKRQGHRPLLVPLAEPEDHGAAALPQKQISQFEVDEVRAAAAGVQQHSEDRTSTHVLPKFDFSQQAADLATVQPLGRKLDPPKFLDLLGRVRSDVALLDQPCEVPPDGDERPVHRGDGLAVGAAQIVPEVGNVPCRDPADRERLPVGRGEPPGKLAYVLEEGPAAVGRQIVRLQKGGEEGAFLRADRNTIENIITRILAALWTQFRHHVDTPARRLG